MEEFLRPKDYATVQSMFSHAGIQERLKGYSNHLDFYPKCAWLSRVVPSPESILETVALMRASGLTASIILPARDEAANIGKTLEQMKFFDEFELGSMTVYDNSSHDNTREIVQAMGVPLVKAEQRGAHYKIPNEALHKGTNIWFGIVDALLNVEEPAKHIVLFSDTDAGLSVVEIMQLLRPFAENPKLNLALPFVSRLTQQGQVNGTLTNGGRASTFTWGPMRDALLSPYVPDIVEHPAQLAGIYGANLEFVSNMEIPHGFGLEVAIQTEAYVYAYHNARTTHEVVKFVPCGIFSQIGQSDHHIRIMSHDIAYELKYRIDALHMQKLRDVIDEITDMSDLFSSTIIRQLQMIGPQVLNIDVHDSLSEFPHIQIKKKVCTDHKWTVIDGKIQNFDNQSICKYIYYLPPVKQFLKLWKETNELHTTSVSNNQSIE
jgi:glycosyltransferase involved in cell wall biosynthesis